MAKRTRAAARAKSALSQRASHPRKIGRKAMMAKIANAVKARRFVFTPEALSYARHRYELAGASLANIAADFGVDKETIRRLAKAGSWRPYEKPPLSLPSTVRLLVKASELEAQGTGEARPSEDAVQTERRSGPPNTDTDATVPAISDTVARLYRAVLEELAAVETLRAQLKREPQSPQDAERTARTLSNLTETLRKLQRMQCAFPQSGPDDDDIPADIDEFRTELARRIEAFVASRTGPGVAEGSTTPSLDGAAG